MPLCVRCAATIEAVQHTTADGAPLCLFCANREPFVNVFSGDAGSLHEHSSLKARRLGDRHPYLELKIGESLEHRAGEWRGLLQRVDHDANWYDKVVTDQTTGRVIHECHEPLSEHRGRGSAKRKPLGGGAA